MKRFVGALCMGLSSAILVSVSGCPGLMMDDKARLSVNRAIWTAAEIEDYEYQFQQVCFCPDDVTRKVVITVEDGEITDVRDASTGDPVDEPSPGFYPTIEDLFDRIEEAIDDGADDIEVDYDDQLGVPTLIEIDPIADAIDDEVTYTAEELAEL